MSESQHKVYRGRTMAEALAEVKKDLGKDAVILRTRNFKAGGVMGVGARPVVEITATTSSQVEAFQPRTAERPTDTSRAQRPPTAGPLSVPLNQPLTVVTRPLVPTSPGLDRAPSRNPAIEPRRAEPSVELPAQPSPCLGTLLTRADLAPVDPSTRLLVQDELSTIKRLVNQLLSTSRQSAAKTALRPPSASAAVLRLGPMSEPLFANYLRLVDGGVDSDLAENLAGRAGSELSEGELTDAAIVRHTLLRHLSDDLRTVAPARPNRAVEGHPRTIALVGPTGVGKTTTVAKLAANFKLRQGLRVGLITCDTYRIAAVEQLKTYAGILGLPLRVVMAPQDIAATCAEFDACDVILIDTAGRSQNDTGRLTELAAYLDAAKPHETHLTLSLNVSAAVMLRTAERFAPLNPDRVVVSKLDEAVHFGPILNLVRRTGLKLSYLTTGQEVPDHIVPASSEQIARAVLDGEWAR